MASQITTQYGIRQRLQVHLYILALLILTSFHPQTDGISKQCIQNVNQILCTTTFVIILRHLVMSIVHIPCGVSETAFNDLINKCIGIYKLGIGALPEYQRNNVMD